MCISKLPNECTVPKVNCHTGADGDGCVVKRINGKRERERERERARPNDCSKLLWINRSTTFVTNSTRHWFALLSKAAQWLTSKQATSLFQDNRVPPFVVDTNFTSQFTLKWQTSIVLLTMNFMGADMSHSNEMTIIAVMIINRRTTNWVQNGVSQTPKHSVCWVGHQVES